jgi:hypothetical protein
MAPTAINGPLGLKFHPSDKANAIADYMEIQFTHHVLCDETMNDWWTLQFKLCSKAYTTIPLREYDHVT